MVAAFTMNSLSEVSAYMDGAQSLPFKYKT